MIGKAFFAVYPAIANAIDEPGGDHMVVEQIGRGAGGGRGVWEREVLAGAGRV